MIRVGRFVHLHAEALPCDIDVSDSIYSPDEALKYIVQTVQNQRPKGKSDQAEFIMLKDGGILFEGNATELREAAKKDEYIHAFLS